MSHNHPLTRQNYSHYPHNRTDFEPAVTKTVTELFIQDNSTCTPTTQDIHNLVRKLKQRTHTASTSGKRLKQWISEFSQEPGNVGGVFVDSVQNKTGATCITLQTKHMRELFHRFPEVVMIDATHGTNSSKYKVFSIMAHDAFGKGQFIHHAAVQNERNPTLATALEEFKKTNPVWTKIKRILIDKNFGEIGVLKTAFPDATLLLCQFHVLKYLREQIASKDYAFNSWQKQQLDGLFNLLVYAKTEQKYLQLREYKRHTMDVGSDKEVDNIMPSRENELGTGRSQFVTGRGQLGTEMGAGNVELSAVGDLKSACTHLKHISLRIGMVAEECGNICTLGNNTNNRLESSWKQLKELVSSFMQVDDSEEEKKVLDAVYKLSVVHDPKYDHEMDFLSKLVSEHACNLVYEQYDYATTAGKYKYHEAAPGVYLIQCNSVDDDAYDEPLSEYSVTKANWSCSCLFMASRLLPCRHVFFIRKDLNFENVIPTQHVNPRWLLSSLRVETDLSELSGESFCVSRVLRESNVCWDSNRKFREANFLSTSISEHLSGLGMAEYKRAMKALRCVTTLFEHGDNSAICAFSRQQPPSSGSHNGSSGQYDQAFGGESGASASAQNTQVATPSTDYLVNAHMITSSANSVGVTGNGELGTDELGAMSSGAELGNENEQPEVDVDRGVTLGLATLTNEFEIVSPPNARGRPKQKPAAVKSKRKQAIEMVQQNLDMHGREINLLTFQQFIFGSKPKPPIAHEIAKLPSTKQLGLPEEVVRIFPMQQINKCTAKVTAYQAKKPGTFEGQLTLEIVGVGVFAYSTIALMRKWHTAVKAVDFSCIDNSSFYVERDSTLPLLIQDWPLLPSKHADMIDLAAKDTLSAQAMQMILHKLFGADSNIRGIDPSTLGISKGAITTDSGYGKSTHLRFYGFQLPFNRPCRGSAVSDDVTTRSSASSRLVTHDPGLGVQTDSFNCGVYVLLAFEIFCGSEPLGVINKKDSAMHALSVSAYVHEARR
ncbi:Zinc finger SWIM domain-containing protein 3 [Phytophthora citrophthora]|uniref:Zinc finger SWIM domain-containing protein 3 n=1 Tax=Phytophthora citrophthora TaxID=4793 RepID=A0AAD9LGD4_9STRA|nr:Zinc finger SWIM domain-containing protein 3 [Phytophthora citrophthora]